MPSEASPAGTSERRRFPRIEADHGEDPGRWLDCDLMSRPTHAVYETDDRGHTTATTRPDTDVDPAGRMVEDRIKSIETEALLRAWEAVERRLAALDDREPRDKVMEWLEARREELPVEAGERIERPSTPSSAVWPDRPDGEQARVAGVSSS